MIKPQKNQPKKDTNILRYQIAPRCEACITKTPLYCFLGCCMYPNIYVIFRRNEQTIQIQRECCLCCTQSRQSYTYGQVTGFELVQNKFLFATNYSLVIQARNRTLVIAEQVYEVTEHSQKLKSIWQKQKTWMNSVKKNNMLQKEQFRPYNRENQKRQIRHRQQDQYNNNNNSNQYFQDFSLVQNKVIQDQNNDRKKPVKVISLEQQKKQKEDGFIQQGKQCSICTLELPPMKDLSVMQCGHKFHTRCIGNWFKRGHTQCPNCRKQLI